MILAALRAIFSYRPSDGPPMPAPTRNMACATVGHLMVLIGGNGAGQAVNVFDISTQSWRRGRAYPRPEGRAQQGVAVFNQKIYLFGGQTAAGGGSSVDTVDVYEPLRDKWSLDIARCPRPVHDPSCIAVGDRIFVFGGDSSGTKIADCHAFDPLRKTWEQLASIPKALDQTFAISSDWQYAGMTGSRKNSKIYLIGGENQGEWNTVWEYTIGTDEWRLAGRLGNRVSSYSVNSTGSVISNGRYAYIAGLSRDYDERDCVLMRVDLRDMSAQVIRVWPRIFGGQGYVPGIGGHGNTLYMAPMDNQGRMMKLRLPAGQVFYQR